MAGAVATVLLAATLCVWGALCLTFWQGSWQLLYHPATAVARTPANVGLPFEAVDFAALNQESLSFRVVDSFGFVR